MEIFSYLTYLLAVIGVFFLIITWKAPGMLNILPWYDPGGCTFNTVGPEALEALVQAIERAGFGPTFRLTTKGGVRAFLACGAHLAETTPEMHEMISRLTGSVTLVDRDGDPEGAAQVITSALRGEGFIADIIVPDLPGMPSRSFVFIKTNAMDGKNGILVRNHKSRLPGKPTRWVVKEEKN